MRYLRATVFFICIFAFVLGPGSAVFAVERDEPDTEYSYGTVSGVSADRIVVSEYDFDDDRQANVTYFVDKGTTFESAGSLSQVSVGDSVDINYAVKDGRKVAVSVDVVRPVEEQKTPLNLQEQ